MGETTVGGKVCSGRCIMTPSGRCIVTPRQIDVLHNMSLGRTNNLISKARVGMVLGRDYERIGCEMAQQIGIPYRRAVGATVVFRQGYERIATYMEVPAAQIQETVELIFQEHMPQAAPVEVKPSQSECVRPETVYELPNSIDDELLGLIENLTNTHAYMTAQTKMIANLRSHIIDIEKELETAKTIIARIKEYANA